MLFLTSTELFVTASVEATDRRERTELMIERFICSEKVEKEGERDEIAPPSPRLLIAAIFCEAEVLSMKN